MVGGGKIKKRRRRKSLLRKSIELGAIGAGIGVLGRGGYNLASGNRINRQILLRSGLIGAGIGAALPSVVSAEAELAARYPAEYDLASKAGLVYGLYQGIKPVMNRRR